MHPLGFKDIYKTIAYIFLSFGIYIFVNKSSLIIPNGNLASFFPYSRFTICSWDNFVMHIFNSSFKDKLQYDKFIYYGNMSRKKSFPNFIKFANFYKLSSYKFLALGYLSNVGTRCDSVKFINSITEVDSCSDILVWTSKFESYGLAYREYIQSNGFLIFLRKKLINDGVENAVYMHSYDQSTPLILFKIKENFKQSLIISNYTSLFDYITQYNHAN
jgi:hypothetical protein